jgi:hypothetical protein
VGSPISARHQASHTKPVIIRRNPVPLAERDVYLWEITHDGELVAGFTDGTAALNYVDRELSAWYRECREDQAQAVTGLAGRRRRRAAQGRRTRRQ